MTEFERYARHLALPEITPAHQAHLKNTRLTMVGAGGLGASALPSLAAAGIGHITIIDHDTIDITNLQRQTIYQTQQTGQSKAQITANYLTALNPDCKILPIAQKFTPDMAGDTDILLDGSDNFETKTLLNKTAITNKIPLITASINRFDGQCGIFAGHASDTPCYHCLFPNLPTNARNCNEAGVLGTAAGLTGMLQAHTALCFLLGIEGFIPGAFFTLNTKTMRLQKLNVHKNKSCTHCNHTNQKWSSKMTEDNPIEFIPRSKLPAETIIVDVRTDQEIAEKPIEGSTHIELSEIPQRYKELPQDKSLAFACAGNVRSHQAAAFVQAMGYNNVCVMDVLAK